MKERSVGQTNDLLTSYLPIPGITGRILFFGRRNPGAEDAP